ncbi:MAG: hypothetical protein ACXVEE_21550 [Polyangiales bacterium]
MAVVWHVVLAAFIAMSILGHFPTRRTTAFLISSMFGSVAATAFAFGNPFNGIVFTLLAIALAVAAPRAGRAGRGASWNATIGLAMIAFGWIYPHFLARGAIAHLYGAPVGLLPCPTLSMAIGIALFTGGLGGMVWMRTLALAGVAYGLVGVFQLQVAIDAVLLAGATALLVATLSPPSRIAARGGLSL